MTSRRDLKDDELTAEQYLLGLGVGSVTFEPDGNIPPDFVINNKIAIEVRRIEDQYWDGAKPQGLRTVQKNIEKTVRSSLSALGSMHPTDSWFVHYNFNRPLPDWRWLQAEIQETLRSFVINPDEGNTWRLHPSFRIRIWRASKKHTQTFLLGGNIDRDQTAFVSQAVSASLRNAIEEKTQKVSAFLSRYNFWWLLLVNHQAAEVLSFDEWREIKKEFVEPMVFEKVVIISPHSPGWVMEIP